jgi:hypothetical protein
LCSPNTGAHPANLDRFLSFIAARLAADDYAKAEHLLQAAFHHGSALQRATATHSRKGEF